MKGLVLGKGGREHALWYYGCKSPLVSGLYCAPGNGGIPADFRRAVNPGDMEDIRRLLSELRPDFVIPGPEKLYADGIVELCEGLGIICFGPTSKAAQLETSKAYMKEICWAEGVPTAPGKVFRKDPEGAAEFIRRSLQRMVVKVDGLAEGKGVTVPDSVDEAITAVYEAPQKFGKAGECIVIEDYLEGPEASMMFLCDGEDAMDPFVARDYKRALEGDEGPTTGGMGAYSPLPDVSGELIARVKSRIVLPILRRMKRDGCEFRGVLYTGLKLTKDGPMLLEINVRWGDPETEVVLPRFEGDIIAYMLSCTPQAGKGMRLRDLPPPRFKSVRTVGVVLTSAGYPKTVKTGKLIAMEPARSARSVVFHAGTRAEGGRLYTDGGRVLVVVGLHEDHPAAAWEAYHRASGIGFEGMTFRHDIAKGVA